jgi:hypothetical protein
MPRAGDHEQAYISSLLCIRPRRKRPDRATLASPAPPSWCPHRRRPLVVGGTLAVASWGSKRREASCPRVARRERDAMSRSTGSASGRPLSLAEPQPRGSHLRQPRPPLACRYQCAMQAYGLPRWLTGCAYFAYQTSFSGDG